MIRTVRSLGVALALSALATTATTACTDDSGGSGGDAPDGAALVSAAAAATRAVETVRFALEVEGTVPGISISRADGRLTKEGEVQGTAVLTATGQPIETEFVVVGDTLYLKGPTGGFQQLPASVAASVYDPTKILDDNLGLAALVAGATQPSVQDTEDVDGTRAHRVRVVFAKNNLGVLLPGVGATADLPGELWLAADQPNRPLRARVQVPATGSDPGGTVTITLSQFNEPVEITAPS